MNKGKIVRKPENSFVKALKEQHEYQQGINIRKNGQALQKNCSVKSFNRFCKVINHFRFETITSM